MLPIHLWVPDVIRDSRHSNVPVVCFAINARHFYSIKLNYQSISKTHKEQHELLLVRGLGSIIGVRKMFIDLSVPYIFGHLWSDDFFVFLIMETHLESLWYHTNQNVNPKIVL